MFITSTYYKYLMETTKLLNKIYMSYKLKIGQLEEQDWTTGIATFMIEFRKYNFNNHSLILQ